MTDRQSIARELTAIANILDGDKGSGREAASLWKKVATQYGEKVAVKLHSELLKKAAKLSEDKRLNPDEELWVPDFIGPLVDGVISKLSEIKRRTT